MPTLARVDIQIVISCSISLPNLLLNLAKFVYALTLKSFPYLLGTEAAEIALRDMTIEYVSTGLTRPVARGATSL